MTVKIIHQPHVPFRQLRTGPIDQWHKEHAAEQANIAKTVRIKAGLQEGKDLHTEYANQGVQHGYEKDGIHRYFQPPPHHREPDTAHSRGKKQEQEERMFLPPRQNFIQCFLTFLLVRSLSSMYCQINNEIASPSLGKTHFSRAAQACFVPEPPG